MSEIRIMKRGKVYQYRFEIASRGGVRRYIKKSGFTSRKEAQEAGAIAYNEYFRTGRKQKIKDMSYEDYLDYWMTNYCYFNVNSKWSRRIMAKYSQFKLWCIERKCNSNYLSTNRKSIHKF